MGDMDDNAGAGPKAAEVGKLSAAALAKRAARASRREQEESGQDKQGHAQDKDNKEEEEDMWTNEYAFSSFSLKVQEEFGGEACVGGTQWPGTSLLLPAYGGLVLASSMPSRPFPSNSPILSSHRWRTCVSVP